MTRRDRLLTTLTHREPDRVPLGFEARPAIREALYRHFAVRDDQALFSALGIDGFSVFGDAYVAPRYIGPDPATGDGITGDFFGIINQRFAPLAFAETVGDLERYRWPSAEWFDYSAVALRCRSVAAGDQLVVVGEGGCGIQHAINLRGYEAAVSDPLLDPNFTHAYLERMGDFFVAWNTRWLSAADGAVDLFRCGDELGSNTALHCSPEVWRSFYKPQLARIFAVAKGFGLKIWFHCCGYCRPLLPDLIEIGVDLWDPAPPTVRDNDLSALKREFGQDITFVGGVDEPNICANGTPDAVRAEVRCRLEQLAPGGGYILGPSQNFTEDVPVENILALYDEALAYGRYTQ